MRISKPLRRISRQHSVNKIALYASTLLEGARQVLAPLDELLQSEVGEPRVGPHVHNITHRISPPAEHRGCQETEARSHLRTHGWQRCIGLPMEARSACLQSSGMKTKWKLTLPNTMDRLRGLESVTTPTCTKLGCPSQDAHDNVLGKPSKVANSANRVRMQPWKELGKPSKNANM